MIATLSVVAVSVFIGAFVGSVVGHWIARRITEWMNQE